MSVATDQYQILINNVRTYRKLNKLTQEALAEKAELSTSYIKQIESKRIFKNMSYETLLKLSVALQVPIRDLFDEKAPH